MSKSQSLMRLCLLQSHYIESALYDHTYSSVMASASTFVDGRLEYIAGWVVLTVGKYVSCQKCSVALVMPAQECTSALLTLKMNGGLIAPSVSVLRIVKQCEIVLQFCVNIKRVLPGLWKRVFVSRILADMPTDIHSNLFQHLMETSKCIEIHP